MQHIEQLSTCDGSIGMTTCTLHEIGVCGGEVLVGRCT